MSVDQQQRLVNGYDKDIADLQKKKANADKKVADEQKKAAGVSISKNASQSTIRSKMREIERHNSEATKAAKESADLQKKIADTTKKRNDAYFKLQSEVQSEQKKQEKKQQKMVAYMKRTYENRISDLEKQVIQQLPDSLSDGEEPEYDVFISHAWEDKESFADEFVKELRSRGIKVWYDTNEIKWGDSMRKRIDDGLRRSRFGIAILSPNYIAEGKYWTKAEFDGLFQLESINGKTLLPIWHGLTKQQVMDFSPMAASKLALTTALMTATEIADEMKNLLSKEDVQNG